jgi:hypothetical protein
MRKLRRDLSQEYGEKIRERLRAGPSGRIAIRTIAETIGYSYEHVRQAVMGKPSGSRAFNDALSKFLALDPDEMWKLAVRTKTLRRYGLSAMRELDPPRDDRMRALWAELGHSDREQLLSIAEALVARNKMRGRRRLSAESG